MKTKFVAKFYRHFPNQKSECDILMRVSCTDVRFSYSIGYSITKKDWSEAKQLPQDRDHLTEIIDRIIKLKARVKEFCKDKKTVYRDDLKNFILIKDGKKSIQAEAANIFFATVERIIEDADSGKLLKEDLKPFAKTTIKNWKASKSRLMEFNPNLSFADNDEKTYNEFKSWANAQDFGASYIDKLIKDWKSFFKYGRYPAPTKFKRLGVGVPEKPYLNTTEIAILEALELTGTDEEIRDRYIVNLYTGLRISDMKNLIIDRIDGDKINFKSTQKTGAPVSIPIAAPIKKMLNKYNGQFPPQHHEVHVNRRIKVICGKAGITKPIELKVSEMNSRLKARLIKEGFMNGSEVTVKIPKNELITNHTARRSMTTNMLRSGIPMNKARKIIAMSLKTLERYDKITAEENADDLKHHSFFAQ